MTYEEAISIIEKRHCNNNERCRDECIFGKGKCEYDVAFSALEKQIPEKPTPHIVQPVEARIKIGVVRWRKGTTVYECPNCKKWISKTYKYCYACGQALDWSDTE